MYGMEGLGSLGIVTEVPVLVDLKQKNTTCCPPAPNSLGGCQMEHASSAGSTNHPEPGLVLVLLSKLGRRFRE